MRFLFLLFVFALLFGCSTTSKEHRSKQVFSKRQHLKGYHFRGFAKYKFDQIVLSNQHLSNQHVEFLPINSCLNEAKVSSTLYRQTNDTSSNSTLSKSLKLISRQEPGYSITRKENKSLHFKYESFVYDSTKVKKEENTDKENIKKKAIRRGNLGLLFVSLGAILVPIPFILAFSGLPAFMALFFGFGVPLITIGLLSLLSAFLLRKKYKELYSDEVWKIPRMKIWLVPLLLAAFVVLGWFGTAVTIFSFTELIGLEGLSYLLFPFLALFLLSGIAFIIVSLGSLFEAIVLIFEKPNEIKEDSKIKKKQNK